MKSRKILSPKKRAKSQLVRPSRSAPSHILSQKLVTWYQKARRPLPWRSSKEPYRIWLSEVMLQQTTVQAVIPYYERFLTHYPDIDSLAQSTLSDIFKLWSGLGYYSRARNLHKAAQHFAEFGFKPSYKELLSVPGLGPYTARAISSLAFNEPVGVVDGNVIRVLSRVDAIPYLHWKPKEREKIQARADALAQANNSSDVNQALMELGATICTRQSPQCPLCPWMSNCLSFAQSKVQSLPLKKPRPPLELWLWKPEVIVKKKNYVKLIAKHQLPFLKNQPVFPGLIVPIKKKPETFDLRHSITHHDIYVQIQKKPSAKTEGTWQEIDKITTNSPSILLQKILNLIR